MQKHAITFGVYLLIAAAFTAFFRWIQNMSAFELETGLMISGVLWSKVALAVCLIALGGIIYLVRDLWYRNCYPAQTYEQLIVGDPYWIDRITKLIAAVMILGAAINLFMESFGVHRIIYGLLSVFAVAMAVAFVKLSKLPLEEKPSSSKQAFLSAVPVVFYLDWLTVSYRIHAADPSVWSYAPEIITICMCIAATFYFAGYGWDFPRPYAALGCSLAAALMSFSILMDDRKVGQQLMLIAGAAMMLYHAWMIVVSMKKEWPAQPENTSEEASEPNGQ